MFVVLGGCPVALVGVAVFACWRAVGAVFLRCFLCLSGGRNGLAQVGTTLHTVESTRFTPHLRQAVCALLFLFCGVFLCLSVDCFCLFCWLVVVFGVAVGDRFFTPFFFVV